MGICAIGQLCAPVRGHARRLNPLAREYLNIAGCEFSPATVLRTAALQSKRKRSLAAYGAAQHTLQLS